LMTRWYQAAAFTPFFRNHAHLDSKRREPWVFDDATTNILRTVTMIRYSLMPLWYTLFRYAYGTGYPVMRPLITVFPFDKLSFGVDNSWMLGDTLLIKPIVEAGKRSMDVYLPSGVWYDYFSYASHNTISPNSYSGRSILLNTVTMSTIPVFIRGGSVLFRKLRLRRSTKTMFYDPYTITIAPDVNNRAIGTVYSDDEHSLQYTTQSSRYCSLYGVSYGAEMGFDKTMFITSDDLTAMISTDAKTVSKDKRYQATNMVERIEILGVATQPVGVEVSIPAPDGRSNPTIQQLQYGYDGIRRLVVIKKPNVLVNSIWKIAVKF